mmetsp:Transcript_75488/g.202231  ORF Transcript_75488/g.202231 Transcript_75488/m.202231 type:complete len:142 (+) Transcript_75488:87-512(+)
MDARRTAKLTKQQVIEIYAIKLHQDDSLDEQMPTAFKVARHYGVSDKAVRDIWKGRTWLRETAALDDPAEAARKLRSLEFPVRRKGKSNRDAANHQNLPTPAREVANTGSLRAEAVQSEKTEFAFGTTTVDPFFYDWPRWT